MVWWSSGTCALRVLSFVCFFHGSVLLNMQRVEVERDRPRSRRARELDGAGARAGGAPSPRLGARSLSCGGYRF